MAYDKLMASGSDRPLCGEDDHDFEYDYSDMSEKDDEEDLDFDSTTEIDDDNYKPE